MHKAGKTSRQSAERHRQALAFLCAAVVCAAAVATVFVLSRNGDESTALVINAREASLLADGKKAFQRGDLAGAGRLFAAAATLSPGDARARYDLGTVQQAQGDANGARASYLKALAAAPDFTSAIFNLATIEAATGNADSASGHYRRVLEIEPRNSSAMWNLGLLVYEKGDRVAGRRLLNRAIATTPGLRSRKPANVTLG